MANQMRMSEYMKLMNKLDSAEQRLSNVVSITSKLTHKWMTYASHRETGLVYDTQVLDEQVLNIRKEIEEIRKKLDENT